MKRRLAPLLLFALVACGREPTGVGQRASTALAPKVQQVRASATAGDQVGARRQLAELRQTVADLRQGGQLSDEGAARVLAAAAQVEAQLSSGATPTSQISPTTPGPGNTRGPTRTTRATDKDKDKEEDDDD